MQAGDADTPGALRQCLHVVAGRKNVVEGAAPLRQQLPHDAGDAADAATARVHVRSQRHVPGPGYALVGRLLVAAIAERVVDHHDTRPRALSLRKVQQRVDRSVGSVDLNRCHSVI